MTMNTIRTTMVSTVVHYNIAINIEKACHTVKFHLHTSSLCKDSHVIVYPTVRSYELYSTRLG